MSEWVTLAKAAKIFDVSTASLRKWCRDGTIPVEGCGKAGKDWRVKLSVVERNISRAGRK